MQGNRLKLKEYSKSFSKGHLLNKKVTRTEKRKKKRIHKNEKNQAEHLPNPPFLFPKIQILWRPLETKDPFLPFPPTPLLETNTKAFPSILEKDE
jgi:hypothetical protein